MRPTFSRSTQTPPYYPERRSTHGPGYHREYLNLAELEELEQRRNVTRFPFVSDTYNESEYDSEQSIAQVLANPSAKDLWLEAEHQWNDPPVVRDTRPQRRPVSHPPSRYRRQAEAEENHGDENFATNFLQDNPPSHWALYFIQGFVWLALTIYFFWRVSTLPNTVAFECYELKVQLLHLGENMTLPLSNSTAANATFANGTNSSLTNISLATPSDPHLERTNASSIHIPKEFHSTLKSHCILQPVNPAVVLSSYFEDLFIMTVVTNTAAIMSFRFTAVDQLKTAPAKTEADFKPASNSKYDPFPDQLRKQVDVIFSRAATAGGFDLLQRAPDDIHQHFCLKKGTIYYYPERDREITKVGAVYHKAAAANVALMDELLKEEQFALENKDTWVELETPFSHLENPGALELHKLRRGEFGWGFDAEKGLSVVTVREWGAVSDIGGITSVIGECCMHVYFVQFMRGSETIPVVRDVEEEARLREQKEKPKPKLKLGINLRAPISRPAKRNPLEEMEKEAEREGMDWDREADDDWE
ncbi:uncharacterized protein N0V89_012505 [Didymosphaeria variabile]|uniref:Uncharacterized protein n=1 Tax=Didymosphaeria variabile TaxID=1932322 RepID=A0A9W9C5H5_9PLEO|nr:uncharacterized protein N0V89_012505 [Didymosphaeria variabile]KAJ4344761.1 hypothetical protein N0V89_012505 [Didymosphaeria variabile]